jgi:hypothetical protein
MTILRLHEHPQQFAFRFKGEGKSVELAVALKEALLHRQRGRCPRNQYVSKQIIIFCNFSFFLSCFL